MSGLAKVFSGAVYGVDAYEVEIEVNVGNGDPHFVVVGLPDTAVKESTDRVWTALCNSGFMPPMGRVTVNLAPADIKKEGPAFDLPIALGALVAERQLVTDVPMCFFLSGGLDSSIICQTASIFRKRNKSSPINTYSVEYADNKRYF